MEENISKENTNKLKETLDALLRNKGYMLFFSVAGLTLFAIIVWILLILFGSPSSSNQSTTRISPSVTLTPSGTVQNPIEINAIKDQTKTQIDPLVKNITYTISKVKMYSENWSLIKIMTPDGNSAIVAAKKEKGTWKVVMGPGSYFDKEDLNRIGAPQNLINEVNDTF